MALVTGLSDRQPERVRLRLVEFAGQMFGPQARKWTSPV